MGLFVASVGGIATLVFGIPIIGYLVQPLVQQPKDVWRDIGTSDSIKVGETVRRNFKYPPDRVVAVGRSHQRDLCLGAAR